MRLSSLSLGFFGEMDARAYALLAFFVPLLVRTLPEVLMGRFIVGFDTVSYYVPVSLRWAGEGVGFFDFLAVAPSFYALLAGLALAGVPLSVSLKVLPPLLHGFLGLSVYGYARKGLLWSFGKSFLVSCLATLYFVGLRVSWDMLRSELSLVFLFAFLVLLRELRGRGTWKGFGLVVPVTVLIVLSHQLVSILMFVVVSAVILQKWLRHEFVTVRNLILSVVPSLAVFGLVAYSNFVSSLSVKSGGWVSLFGFGSYPEMLLVSLGFMVFCCLPLLPLVFLGLKGFRVLELGAWVIWCLIAALLVSVSPSAMLFGGYRWVLLLVFPLAFFAVEGFYRLRGRALKWFFAGLLIFLSFGFVLLPAEAAFPYFGVFRNYVPSSMLQNSVPLRDCGDVVSVLSWYGGNVGSDGVLLVHDAFHGWALLYLNDSARVLCYGYDDPESVARGLALNGSARVFVVWWVSGEGWHGVETLPSCFTEVFQSGRIAVYEFAEA